MQNIAVFGSDTLNERTLFIADGNAHWFKLLGRQHGHFLKNQLCFHETQNFYEFDITQDHKTLPLNRICTPIFTVSLFTIATAWGK